MRHILLAQAVTAASFGMLEAAFPTALVAAAGIPHRGSASLFGTATDAITLTSIAGAADDNLHTAAIAEEHPPSRFHWRFPSRQRDIDRDIAIVEYSPCTRARHRVGTASG